VCDEGTFSAVRSGGSLSDWFETTAGVMQGCVLSPQLFNVFLEAIMSRAVADRREGIVFCGKRISNLRFVDDISTLAESKPDLQEVMRVVSREAKALGMKMNTDKTCNGSFCLHHRVYCHMCIHACMCA